MSEDSPPFLDDMEDSNKSSRNNGINTDLIVISVSVGCIFFLDFENNWNLVLMLLLGITCVLDIRQFVFLLGLYSLVPYIMTESLDRFICEVFQETKLWWNSPDFTWWADSTDSPGYDGRSTLGYVAWQELKAQAGDIIEFAREPNIIAYYRHFGIYDGVGNIIHYVINQTGHGRVDYDAIGDVSFAGHSLYYPQTESDGIFGTILKFLDGFDENQFYSRVRVNNMAYLAHSKGLTSKSMMEIVDTARAFARSTNYTTQYNRLTQNCEHFATLCRYGTPFSLQSDNFTQYWNSQLFHDFKIVFICYQIVSAFSIASSTENFRAKFWIRLNKLISETQVDNILYLVETLLLDLALMLPIIHQRSVVIWDYYLFFVWIYKLFYLKLLDYFFILFMLIQPVVMALEQYQTPIEMALIRFMFIVVFVPAMSLVMCGYVENLWI